MISNDNGKAIKIWRECCSYNTLDYVAVTQRHPNEYRVWSRRRKCTTKLWHCQKIFLNRQLRHGNFNFLEYFCQKQIAASFTYTPTHTLINDMGCTDAKIKGENELQKIFWHIRFGHRITIHMCKVGFSNKYNCSSNENVVSYSLFHSIPIAMNKREMPQNHQIVLRDKWMHSQKGSSIDGESEWKKTQTHTHKP